MWSPIKLLITALVAAAIIYIALGFFGSGDDTLTFQELKKGFDYAELNEGKMLEAQLPFKKGSVFSAKNLDTKTRNARFECASPYICQGNKIEVSARRIAANETEKTLAYFRCKTKTELKDCVAYIGGKPANTEILRLNFPEKLTRNQNVTLSFELNNNGSLDALDLGHEIKIYSKKRENGEEKRVLILNFPGRTWKLPKGESKIIVQQLRIGSPGMYSLEVVAEGEDAGIALTQKSFEVTDAISGSCIALEKGKTAMENGVCRTEHTCSGCEFGFECSSKWVEKGLKKSEIKQAYPTGVYTEKEALNGECK